ncbi:hypothetical protein GCM10022386_15770 [Flavobacterium cheonhonense]|uniref:Uncharacterized protein n=1 Tax=Flavobacterium cheonhonense TaxID=706185 RepID=A0ABP7TWR6_9FLAO
MGHGCKSKKLKSITESKMDSKFLAVNSAIDFKKAIFDSSKIKINYYEKLDFSSFVVFCFDDCFRTGNLDDSS